VSDQHNTAPASGDFRIPAGSPWAQAWKMAAALGVLGLVAAGIGYGLDSRRFAFAWLMGFVTVLTMGLGSVFFVLVQHLTSAGWSVSVRRVSEFFVAGMVIIPVLFLPNLLGVSDLYPWWNKGEETTVAHAQEHGEPAAAAHEEHGAAEHGAAAEDGGEHHSPEHAQHEATLAKKHAFLNQQFFYGRAAIYLVIWVLLSLFLFGRSTAQDKSGDPALTVKLARLAPVATIAFAFSLTFAGFDWVMSLMPNWYSTMFGVRIFAASAVLGLALNVLVSLGLHRSGISRGAVHVEHFHDLGKLMFGFLVFWAYISFSEFMLIWYAAIPEETAYYHLRWDHDWWKMISLTLVTVKFIIPFFLVMSRNAKRNLGLLGLGAGWIAALHLVEMYYWIMPHFAPGQDVAFSVIGFVTDAGCVLACVGLYLAVVFRRMLNHPVIPVRDPRLQRALDFVNA